VLAVNEFLTYEALGLCGEGEAGQLDLDNDDTTYGGRWVANPSGGLISKDHPLKSLSHKEKVMAEAHVSGDLPLSQDGAWKLLSDLSSFEQWITIHDAWKSDIPDLKVGAKVTEQLTVMGMTNVIEWTIDAYDPPSSLTISGAGLAGAQIAFTLSVAPNGDNATVTIDAGFTGQMMVGAIGDAVQKNATIELEKFLAKLQELAA
jgi:hypothetical protein